MLPRLVHAGNGRLRDDAEQGKGVRSVILTFSRDRPVHGVRRAPSRPSPQPGHGTMGPRQFEGEHVARRRNVPPMGRRRESRCRYRPVSEWRARRRPRHPTIPGRISAPLSSACPDFKCQRYRSDPFAWGRIDTRAWAPLRARARADAMSRRAKGSDTTASSARRRPWRCRKDIAALRWRGA